MKAQTTEAVIVEKEFEEDFIGERDRDSVQCATVLENLKYQYEVRDFTEGRASVLVLLCDPLLKKTELG